MFNCLLTEEPYLPASGVGQQYISCKSRFNQILERALRPIPQK